MSAAGVGETAKATRLTTRPVGRVAGAHAIAVRPVARAHACLTFGRTSSTNRRRLYRDNALGVFHEGASPVTIVWCGENSRMPHVELRAIMILGIAIATCATSITIWVVCAGDWLMP